MSIKLKSVLSAALVLGTASAALAASKHHPARHADRTTVQRNVVAPGNYANPGRLAYRGYSRYGAFNAYNAYPGYNRYGASNVYPGSFAYQGYNGYGGSDAYAAAAARNYARAGYNAFDYANTVPRRETYIYIQDWFFRRSSGD